MPATVRILIVEDDPQDAALAERQVRRADIFCTFRRVETRDSMVQALREFVPDVVITDHSLPAFGARDALQLAQQLTPGTPVIVVTGRLGDEPAVQYLQAGAADYIVKDHLHRLGPAVLRALDTKRSHAAQVRAHQLQTATYRIAQVAITAPGVRYGEREQEILQFVSAQVAMAIERSRAEAELRASETTYRSLVQDSPFGIFRSTPGGQFLAVNPALVSILGYDSEAELLQK